MSFRRWLIVAVVGVAVVLIAGVTIIKRIETGRWQAPSARDFAQAAKGRPRSAAKTIFLERRAITLRPGADDAPAGIASVIKNRAKLPGWKGSPERWAQLVACVRAQFSTLDVLVTDERPLHRDFVLVAVGGSPRDVGLTGKRVGGLAPYTGEVIVTPVVLAFENHDVRAVCDTITKHVARTYGRDQIRQLVSVLGSRSRP